MHRRLGRGLAVLGATGAVIVGGAALANAATSGSHSSTSKSGSGTTSTTPAARSQPRSPGHCPHGAMPGNGSGSGNGKAKYNPEATFPNDFNMCQKVDLGHFATSFEKETSAPLPFSQLANNISTASCSFVRQHRSAANVNLTITASIYPDTSIATSQQKNARVNAQQVDPTFTTVANVGDEAILYRNKATQPNAPGQQAYYTESIRDGNLILTGTLIAGRTDSVDWTTSERNQITDDLQLVAKNALNKLTGA